jgi:hypothetical protein
MKKAKFGLIALLAVYILTGCNKDEEKVYYSTLGVLQKTAESTIIEADGGEMLLINNPATLPASLIDQDRVLAYFSVAEVALPAEIDMVVDIYSIDKIPLKQIIELTAAIEDSNGNDPLTVSSIWVVRDYLNFSFMFIGGNETHYLNLVEFPDEPINDTINLEIRHNNKNDNGSTYYNGFVNFDLSSLQQEGADSVVLRIKAKEYDNRQYEKYFTYKF